MNNNLPTSADRTQSMVDAAAQAADGALHSTHQKLDQLGARVESARATAGPALQGLANSASDLAQRSSDALQRQAERVRTQALQARDATRGYIEQDPLKAVLIAAAAGAALMWLGSLLSRRGVR